MSYRARQRRSLLGLGATDDAPITVGDAAAQDPILATASVLASNVLLKMAAAPRAQRIAVMVRTLNAAHSGLGDRAGAAYMLAIRGRPASERDQLMFDVIRTVIAAQLVHFTKQAIAKRGGVSGLGGLGDAATDMAVLQQGFCIFGAGGVAITGGFFDQLGSGGGKSGGQPGAITGAAQTAANIVGCNAGAQQAAAAQAQAQAQLAQSAQAQAALQQQAREDRIFKYALLGGGGLLTLVVVTAIMKR